LSWFKRIHCISSGWVWTHFSIFQAKYEESAASLLQTVQIVPDALT
jgi:hypothetical protein